MRTHLHIPRILAVLLMLASAHAQSVSVHVATVAPPQHHAHTMPMQPTPIVAWLTPLNPTETRPPQPTHSYTLLQKNKQFTPHLLVVPTGSNVEFPNLDPFFHNVFSLFNGRRFDLGLYEAGSRRTVRFDHEGVSYIFCNIHPEMGAVIVSLSSPYYAISSKDGTLTIPNVPAGDYELNLWAENVAAADLAAAKQRIHIAAQNIQLPNIELKANTTATGPHLNKFGEEYKKPEQAPY